MSAPSVPNVEVAVPPKYAGPYDEKRVVEAPVTARRLVEELKVNAALPPNDPPLLNCTCPSAPPGVPPLVMPSDEVAVRE